VEGPEFLYKTIVRRRISRKVQVEHTLDWGTIKVIHSRMGWVDAVLKTKGGYRTENWGGFGVRMPEAVV
jgi:hypothetical protein